MKARINIAIITAVLLPGFLVKAQINDSRSYSNDYPGTTIVNNYYDYDYFYSSRINRFHRSFATFNYYTPLFTDSYWYNYSPYSLGLSIYGGSGIGLGFGLSYNYPSYYDYDWYTPYFGSSYYYGYNPFYNGRWYSPVVLDLSFRNRWYYNNYVWRDRDRFDFDYRHGYNNYFNNHYSRSDNHISDINRTRGSDNNYSRTENGGRRVSSNYTESENTTGTGRSGNVNSNESRRVNNNANSSNSGNNVSRRVNNSSTYSNSGTSNSRISVNNKSGSNVSNVQSIRRSAKVSAPPKSSSTSSVSKSSSRRGSSTKSGSSSSKKSSSEEKTRR